MKWYLGDINSDNTVYKSKVENLFKENFLIEPPQDGLEISDGNYSYAEIYNNKYIHNHDNEILDDIVILGDIEIYNKSQLENKYFDDESNGISNNFLVNLYKLKGIDFVKEISGEFSFVIYDKKKKKIYLVTDHVGIKPLFWTKKGEKVCYATDIFLLKDYFDITKLNKKYFEEYYYSGGQINSDQTPYIDVYRVESGSYVSISIEDGNIDKHKYWDLVDFKREIYYETEEEYIEKFRELLKNAVNRRLLENDKDGVLMSGGLDSTSLFAISKSLTNKEILPICGVFDILKDCDERYYIQQVLDKYDQIASFVISDEFGMLKGYPKEYFHTKEPYVNALTLKFTGELIKSASENGIKNIIDGFAADHLLTGSLVGVIDKIKRGKLIEAFKDIREVSMMENDSFFNSIKKYVLSPLINPEKLPNIDENICFNLKDKLNKIKNYNKKTLYIQMSSAKAIRYSDREICPRYNISAKHPFLDKDLIEYVYSIPGDLRLNKESSKFILRKAVKEILPTEVVSRITKTQHVSLTFKGLNEVWAAVYNYTKEFRIGDLEIVNMSKEEWTEQLSKYRSGQVVREDFLVLLSMELWIVDYYKNI